MSVLTHGRHVQRVDLRARGHAVRMFMRGRGGTAVFVSFIMGLYTGVLVAVMVVMP